MVVLNLVCNSTIGLRSEVVLRHMKAEELKNASLQCTVKLIALQMMGAPEAAIVKG
jgi:hypothetical protein